MATHDYVIANGTGAAVRSDLNDALAAIVSNNSSSSEPATTYAYQWWADTTANVLKIRNSANNAWITLRELDGTMLIEDGTASLPGLAFADDTNTGIFSGGADEINISTGGTERVVVNSSGKVGVGSTAPDAILEVGGVATSGETEAFAIERSDGVDLYRINYDPSTNSMEFQANNKQFAFQNLSSFAESVRIDDNGRLLVGTSSSPTVSEGSLSRAVVQGYIGGSTADGMLSIQHGGTPGSGGNVGKLHFTKSDGAVFATISCQADGAVAAGDYPGRLVFSTTADGASSPTERMRIDSSGNVGIGVTTPENDLSLGGVGSIAQDANSLYIGNNFSGTGANFRKTGNYAQQIHFDTALGNILFKNTASTGTDGSAITFSERMRINSSGQVLIGQTSATSVLGNGVGINSGIVGSAYNTGALSLTGGGGDFYGLTFNKTAASNAEAFGFLSVYSNVTHSLRVGYNDGSTNTTIAFFHENGNFTVAGALSKGSGSFRIDHPLPAKTETHDLVHSFIEGPQADLIYRGKVDLAAGAATVNLDTAARMTEGTFVLLNTNVQCFTSNESDWTAVRGSVSGNTLTIAAEDNTSTATISWLVIGERQDQHMLDTDWTDDNGRVITEPEKPS